jgi:thiosulfate/3-mercaptopyruvate sulfurtransferase
MILIKRLMYTTLIDANTVHENLDRPNWLIVDCRYDLTDKSYGRNAYLESHIPGAVYADLHDDLSGPPVTDYGRHPLPTSNLLNTLFKRLGISGTTQVVAYDHVYGSFAARLWWLLRYMGHDAVAVLDGGWQAWLEADLPIQSGEQTNKPGDFQGNARTEWLVTVDQVPAAGLLIDSRDPVRYRGESEPLDRAAGHIPGAINHFWKDNLDSRGYFKDSKQILKEFQGFLAETTPSEAVFYCGSGVTACHNLLAAAHAGLPAPKLYAGSWSDWCSVPERQVATGDEPGCFSDPAC